MSQHNFARFGRGQPCKPGETAEKSGCIPVKKDEGAGRRGAPSIAITKESGQGAHGMEWTRGYSLARTLGQLVKVGTKPKSYISEVVNRLEGEQREGFLQGYKELGGKVREGVSSREGRGEERETREGPSRYSGMFKKFSAEGKETRKLVGKVGGIPIHAATGDLAPDSLRPSLKVVSNTLKMIPVSHRSGVKDILLVSRIDSKKLGMKLGENENTAGIINSRTREMILGANTAFIDQTVGHEIGHDVYDHKLSGGQRKEWDRYSESHTGRRITDYAGTSVSEHFSESYAYYFIGRAGLKHMDPGAFELMERFFGGK